MINIPNNLNREWHQRNDSDLFGNVWMTKGITFDELGYLKLSYSSRALITQATTDFDNPAVILFSSDYGYFVETWDSAWSVAETPFSVFPTKIATAGVPSGDIQSDAVFFGGLMVVTQDTDVDYYDPAANSWTDTNIVLTNGNSYQHQAVNFVSLSQIAIANVNTVKMYGTPLVAAPTLITTLTIGSDFAITAMCYFNQNLYVATRNLYGGHAFLYVWNGLGTAANQVYEVPAMTILSLCAHQDGVVLLVSNGVLLKFNGGSFDELAAFPLYYTDQTLSDPVNTDMYKNIMKSNGNLLYILFCNDRNGGVGNGRLLNMPDGIWCYDPAVGLYHRYSLSNALVSVQATSTVNTTTNVITVTTAFPTGTQVVFQSVFGLTPLISGYIYYVIKVDATHIKLATTYANAIAGTEIDLVTSSGSNDYTFFPNIDFGQKFTKRVMSIMLMDGNANNRALGTDIIWGGEVVRRDNTGDYGTLGSVAFGIGTRGYFITPKIPSSDVTDTFNKVTLKFLPFLNTMDSIIIKYRVQDSNFRYIVLSEWDITWTSTTTFTSTETGWANAEVGDEIEVLQGAAGGLLAHITAILLVTGTYTITIDESYDMYASGDISRATFDKWVKWKTIVYGDSFSDQSYLSEQLGKVGKFLQLKIELRGVQVGIEELLVDNKYRLAAREK